jgi:hypothetical protein
MQLHPSSAIRHALIDGLVVILNLKDGSYYILDDIASIFWQSCIENTCQEAALSCIADSFEAERARLKADFDLFIRSCTDKGFILATKCSTDMAPSRSVRVRLPIWHAWWCMMCSAMSLRWRGFGRTYSRYAGLVGSRESQDVDQNLSEALRIFLRAENFTPIRQAPKDCLPRSLALFHFLRDMGFSAAHYIGVQRFPFRAHAWVEHGGKVLLDVDRRAQFAVLARIGS